MGGQAEAAGDAVGIVRSEARKIRTPLTECPDLESEEVVTPADITRRGGITRARVTQVMGTSESGIPNASATPLPYAGSAFRQLPMWRTLISLGASPMARAVFAKSTFCCAALISRKSRPGWG